MSARLNLHSPRARKARMSLLFDSKPLRVACLVIAFSSLAGWLYSAIFMHMPLAHLLLCVAASTLIPVLWYHGELKLLPPIADLGSEAPFEQLLERKLLGSLSGSVTAAQLAEKVNKIAGGRFFASRYAIDFEFLKKMLEGQPDVDMVLESARQLAAGIEHETEISAAAVSAALIFSLPEYQFYLAQLQLDKEDILAGINWQAHITGVFKRISEHQSAGPLATGRPAHPPYQRARTG